MTFQMVKSLQQIRTSWSKLLLEIYYDKSNECINKKKLDATEEFINHKLQIYCGRISIYPPFPLFFNAFNYFDYENTKVVIIGQDPYHQPGQAMGLSFSVFGDVKIPPSLKNIYKELDTDIDEFVIPDTGNLTKWADQGVLLLNASLSVLESRPNSHRERWEFFTDMIVSAISDKTQNVVFMLWGNFAKKKRTLIHNQENHCILEANHPSPLSANRGGWFGSRHFSKANKYLEDKGRNSINWMLV